MSALVLGHWAWKNQYGMIWVYSNVPPQFRSIALDPPPFWPTRHLLLIVLFIVRNGLCTYPYHSRRLQWSPLSADLIAARQKIGCVRSVIGRTDSRVTLMGVPFVGPSTNTRPGDLGGPRVTGRTLDQNPLACNVHSPIAMYIYRRRTHYRREWCVQWWHAEYRSLSEF